MTGDKVEEKRISGHRFRELQAPMMSVNRWPRADVKSALDNFRYYLSDSHMVEAILLAI
ncbi:MAG: hypothetical protein ACJZ8R_05915 [Pseudohongiellaceae bacterium]